MTKKYLILLATVVVVGGVVYLSGYTNLFKGSVFSSITKEQCLELKKQNLLTSNHPNYRECNAILTNTIGPGPSTDPLGPSITLETFGPATTPETSESNIFGDIDANGTLDTADSDCLMLTINDIAQKKPLSACFKTERDKTDLNCDGKLNVLDQQLFNLMLNKQLPANKDSNLNNIPDCKESSEELTTCTGNGPIDYTQEEKDNLPWLSLENPNYYGEFKILSTIPGSDCSIKVTGVKDSKDVAFKIKFKTPSIAYLETINLYLQVCEDTSSALECNVIAPLIQKSLPFSKGVHEVIVTQGNLWDIFVNYGTIPTAETSTSRVRLVIGKNMAYGNEPVAEWLGTSNYVKFNFQP